MTEDAIFWGLTTGDKLWTYLGGLLAVTLIGWVVKKWPSKVGEYIAGFVRVIRDAVAEVWQTYVAQIKKGREDGTLTAEEKAEAKRRAFEIIRSNLGKKGLARIMSIFGLDAPDGWIGSQIEVAVAEAKLLGKAIKGGAASTAPLPAPPR